MVIVSILSQAEFGRNDDREDASHFILLRILFEFKIQHFVLPRRYISVKCMVKPNCLIFCEIKFILAGTFNIL